MSEAQKCSVPFCPHMPAVQLKAAPHGVANVKPPRFTFWFCTTHASEYEALGYQR